MGFFKRPQPTLPPPYPSAARDFFTFSESVVASVNAPSNPPLACGHVRIEALDSGGSVLALDTFAAPFPAPATSWSYEDIPATFIHDGASDARYQELMLPAGRTPPFDLPPHLAKSGVEHYRILWSCDA